MIDLGIYVRSVHLEYIVQVQRVERVVRQIQAPDVPICAELLRSAVVHLSYYAFVRVFRFIYINTVIIALHGFSASSYYHICMLCVYVSLHICIYICATVLELLATTCPRRALH
jgi:hypothetical protein